MKKILRESRRLTDKDGNKLKVGHPRKDNPPVVHYDAPDEKTKKEIIKALCEEDLTNYIKIIAPYAVMGKVHEDFCEFLTKKDGSHYRLGLLPRAHRKSFLVAMFVCREIVKNPAITILYLSATSDLAEAQLRLIKQTLESPKHQKYWSTLINPDEGKREKWTTTEICVDHPSRKTQGVRDSTVKAGGLTTTITGFHADLIILDDLVEPNNNNAAGRRQVAERYSQLQSILNPNGRIVAVGTRYDPKDLYDTLINTREEIYNRNGEYTGERPQWDVFQKVVEVDGEFLWPRTKRADGKYFGFDMKELARIKAGYDDKTQFYAQYYNDPNQRGAAKISSEMFEYYDPNKLTVNGGVWRYNGDILNIFGAVDFGYSLSNRADDSAIAAIGVDAYSNYYVLAIDVFKTDKIHDYFTHLLKMNEKWNYKKVRIEATAAQQIILKELKKLLKEDGVRLNIEEYKPTRDKEERMDAILRPKYEEHKVFHYRGGNCELLEQQLTSVRPEHDDIKNAVADALEIAVAPTGAQWRSSNVRQPVRLGKFGGTCYV